MTEQIHEKRAQDFDTHQRVLEMETQLQELKAKVDEIYEIVAAAKGFFKVLGAIGTGVKWLVLICGSVALAWAAIRGKP